MEIRALTGFYSQTLQKYGRSYSPLNGHCSPGIGGGNFSIPYTIPSYIPPQQIEMLDPTTGKKKLFSVANIQQLISLILQGFMLFSTIKGGTGSTEVQGPKPTQKQIDTRNEGTSLSFAGINITTLVGVVIIAALLTKIIKK